MPFWRCLSVSATTAVYRGSLPDWDCSKDFCCQSSSVSPRMKRQVQVGMFEKERDKATKRRRGSKIFKRVEVGKKVFFRWQGVIRKDGKDVEVQKKTSVEIRPGVL